MSSSANAIQVSLRIPKELLRRIDRFAWREDTTRTAAICQLVECGLQALEDPEGASATKSDINALQERIECLNEVVGELASRIQQSEPASPKKRSRKGFF